MVRRDRVRKSSDGMDEKLMVEKDLAADRKARNEAVRLDLKAYLRGLNCSNKCGVCSSSSSMDSGSASSISASVSGLEARGCSRSSPGGERTGSKDRRIGDILRPRNDGLGLPGVSTDEMPSVTYDSPSDGIESIDMVRVDRAEPTLQSLTEISSSANSSGGDKSTFMGP